MLAEGRVGNGPRPALRVFSARGEQVGYLHGRRNTHRGECRRDASRVPSTAASESYEVVVSVGLRACFVSTQSNPTTATTRGTATRPLATRRPPHGVPLGVGCGNTCAPRGQPVNKKGQLADPNKALTGQSKRPITRRRHGQHGVAYGVPLPRKLRQHQRGHARAARRAVVRAGGKAATGGQEQGSAPFSDP